MSTTPLTAPGPVRVTRARSTGTIVEVWRSDELNIDPANGGPWLTLCQHGNNVQHATRALAISWAAEPGMWCPACESERRRAR